ncbi:MAG: hypothetical protein HEQ20_10765 [Aphanizomenon flos-aquae KM1D3_PB]|uniref:hypothetical protein n=1 Tax=Aphanizomenon flos-aquae TaxID=1176 RepID=UPI000B1B62D0|nr:hypothetical protein [Aphanizomenon flos-aquae]QSV71150.1 MAG: hypothetical protein HEQ20_10765 [Aphanizomenon flos-aquae KM1D3_PB]
MLHTLFSNVPVEQQETVAGGNSYCSCSNKEFISPEESEKLKKILEKFFGFTLP